MVAATPPTGIRRCVRFYDGHPLAVDLVASSGMLEDGPGTRDPKTGGATTSDLPPLFIFLLQMVLELLEPVAEVACASPTLHVAFDQALLLLFGHVDVTFHEREVVEVDEEVGVEAVVVLLALQTGREVVDGDDVDVQGVHAGLGVDPDFDVWLEIAPRG